MDGNYKYITNTPALKKQPLKNFLCCSVKVWSLIIGWFHVISSFLGISILVGYLIIVNNITPEDIKDHKRLDGSKDKMLEEKEKEMAIITLKVFLGVFLFIFTIVFLLHVVLLVGVYKKNATVLTTFLISLGFVLCLRVIGLCFSIFENKSLSCVLIELVLVAISTFGIAIVYSYKVQLQNERMVRASEMLEAQNEPNMLEAPPPYDPYYKG